MAEGATPIARGCGRRKAGGVYAELQVGPGGIPLEEFLLDPPIPVDGLSSVTPVGVSTLERGGATHVLDWIGSEHYPNVADFIEEVRVAGLSRRLPGSFDFSKLSDESRILTIHARAYVENTSEIRQKTWATRYHCPKRLDAHVDVSSETCLGVAWEDVEHGESIAIDAGPTALIAGRMVTVPNDWRARLVRRKMPGFTYCAYQRPEGVSARYRPAIFGSFPIGRLAVVRDPLDRSHELPLVSARTSKMEVAEVEE